MPGVRATQPFKAVILLLLATVGWGLSFPTMKALEMSQRKLLPDTSSWFFSSLSIVVRFGVAAVIVALWSVRTLPGLNRKELHQGIGLACFGSLGLLLQMDGLVYTAASTSAFLTQCYCFIIPLFVAIRTRAVPSPLILLCSVIVTAGVAILSRFNFQEMKLGRGEVETLLASLFFTGQILWLERPTFATNNMNHTSIVMFGLSALLMAPVLVASGGSLPLIAAAYSRPAPLLFAGILTIVCTLGSYVIMNYWQSHLDASQAGLIYCAEPVFASLFALFLPGWFSTFAGIAYANETITSHLLLGGGLITAANVLILIRAATKRPVNPEYTQPVAVKSS